MISNLLRVFIPAIILVALFLGLYLTALAVNTEIVSYTFLIGYPILAGLVIMHYRPKDTFQTFGKALVWLIGIMVLSILAAIGSGVEGLLCITMAVFPILCGTLIGGVVYLLFLRWKGDAAGAIQTTILPFLALFFIEPSQGQPQIYEISDTIIIDAKPDVVFKMLKTIPDISPQEISIRVTHLLGIPKPTSAVWEEGPTGPMRHSYWGEDLHFYERITLVKKNRSIEWDFEFPEGWITDGIEDPHIKVGGEYFDVLSGGYSLVELNGKTKLTLTTRTYDGSNLGPYAKFWHEYFFGDFHGVILELVKARTEAIQS